MRPAKPQICLRAYAQSDQSICLSVEYSMTVKLLTEHHLEFLSLKGGCTGTSESPLVKMSHCWKSRVTALIKVNSSALNFEIADGPTVKAGWVALQFFRNRGGGPEP